MCMIIYFLFCAFVFARSDWIDLGLLLASERWTPNMQKVHSYIWFVIHTSRTWIDVCHQVTFIQPDSQLLSIRLSLPSVCPAYVAQIFTLATTCTFQPNSVIPTMSMGTILVLHSPAISLGFTILGQIFAYVTVFFNLTIEVVTFRLRGCIGTIDFSHFIPLWVTLIVKM